jgi:hypothetical protein
LKYKINDIVLVKSRAGETIPSIHVRLLKRIVVKEKKGKQVGIRKTMDWPGYCGWEATPVFKEEIDYLRKVWSIPLEEIEKDITFVYDDSIVKKPRKPTPAPLFLKKPSLDTKGKKKKQKRRIVRNNHK